MRDCITGQYNDPCWRRACDELAKLLPSDASLICSPLGHMEHLIISTNAVTGYVEIRPNRESIEREARESVLAEVAPRIAAARADVIGDVCNWLDDRDGLLTVDQVRDFVMSLREGGSHG